MKPSPGAKTSSACHGPPRTSQAPTCGSQPGDVALARGVLDHNLADLAGVHVPAAARGRVCLPPDRAINWADLQALVPRVTDTAPPGEDAADGGWWVPDVDVLGEFVHRTGRYRQITEDEGYGHKNSIGRQCRGPRRPHQLMLSPISSRIVHA